MNEERTKGLSALVGTAASQSSSRTAGGGADRTVDW
jgi:hypothetical protein